MNKLLFTLLTPSFRSQCQYWLQELGSGKSTAELNIHQEDVQRLRSVCRASAMKNNYYKFIKNEDANAIIFSCFYFIENSENIEEVSDIDFFIFQCQWASLYSESFGAIVRSKGYKHHTSFGKKMYSLYEYYIQNFTVKESDETQISLWQFENDNQIDLDLQSLLFRHKIIPMKFMNFLRSVRQVPWNLDYIVKLQEDLQEFKKVCSSGKVLPYVGKNLFWISSLTRGTWIKLFLEGVLEDECYIKGFEDQFFPCDTEIPALIRPESLRPIVYRGPENDAIYAKNLVEFSSKWYSNDIMEDVYNSFHYHPSLISLFLYQQTPNVEILINNLNKSISQTVLIDLIIKEITFAEIPEISMQTSPFTSMNRNLIEVDFNLRSIFRHCTDLRIQPFKESYFWIIDFNGNEKAVRKHENLDPLFIYFSDKNDPVSSWLNYTPRLSFGDMEPYLIAAMSHFRQNFYDENSLCQYFDCMKDTKFEIEVDIEVENNLGFIIFKDNVPEWVENLKNRAECLQVC